MSLYIYLSTFLHWEATMLLMLYHLLLYFHIYHTRLEILIETLIANLCVGSTCTEYTYMWYYFILWLKIDILKENKLK